MGCCSNRSFGRVFILDDTRSTKFLIFFGKSGIFAICGTFEKTEEIETGHTALKMKCFCGMPLIFFEWRAIIDLRVRTN